MRKARQNMQWGLLAVLTLLLCVGPGCASKKAVQTDAVAEIQFFDSFSFDRKLSSSLRADLPEVTIVFPAAITLNSVPERLDIWLSKVEEYGGTVELVPVDDTGKGILSEILSFMVAVYDYIKDKAIYSPVEDYNAQIHYLKTTGIVTKVLFVRKPVPMEE